MNLMTYSEMVQATPNLFPEKVDEATQNTIFDWFQFRQVVDNTKFPVYFKRVLNRDYDRYKELLRVEPGYAKYDWLVQNYNERLIQHTGETTGQDNTTVNGSVSNTGSNSSTTTNDLETLTQNRGTDQNSGSTNTTDNKTFSGTSSETIAKTGDDTTNTTDSTTTSNTITRTGTDTTTLDGENTEGTTGTDVNLRTPNLTTTTNNTNTSKKGQTIEISETGSQTNKNVHNEESYTDGQNINKSLPQSTQGISISSVGFTEDVIPGDSASVRTVRAPANLDFTYATQQSENLGHTASSSNNSDKNSSTKSSTTSYGAGQDTVQDSGTSAQTGTEESRLTHGTTVAGTVDNVTTVQYNSGSSEAGTVGATGESTITYNSETERSSTDSNTSTDTTSSTNNNTTTYNSDTTTSNTGTVTKVDSNNVSSESENTSVKSTTSSENKTDKERYTGRTAAPQDLLDNAVVFIQNTSAWLWLQSQLEPCFMSVFELDAYEPNWF